MSLAPPTPESKDPPLPPVVPGLRLLLILLDEPMFKHILAVPLLRASMPA